MTDLDRAQFLAIFEQAAATPLQGHDHQWVWLIADVLKMPICYLPAVQVALRQGRWRSAKNPRGYIKTVAQREAVALGLAPMSDKGLGLTVPRIPGEQRSMSHDQYIDYMHFDGPVKEGGVWHARDSWDDDLDRRTRGVAFGGRLVAHDLLKPEDDEEDARLVIDWQKVAERAGLDEDEGWILELRLSGFTRERILSSVAEDDEERRAYQAAWRRLDRDLPRLQDILWGVNNPVGRGAPQRSAKKSLPKTSPKSNFATLD